MNRTELQTELPLRRRVQLNDTAEAALRVPADPGLPARGIGEGLLSETFIAACLGPTTARDRVAGESIMDTVVRREAIRQEEAIGYTAWFTNRPDCSGFYEVRQKSARLTTKHVRVWYDAPTNAWWFGKGTGQTVEPLAHSLFMLSHFWRGLRAPHPGGYTYRVPGQRVRLLVAA